MGSWEKRKKELATQKTSIYAEYARDRSSTRMLTIDGGIFLTRAGVFEFVNFYDLFVQQYNRPYLRGAITKQEIRAVLEKVYQATVPEEFRVGWTLTFYYYFRLGTLRFYVGKQLSDLPEQDNRIVKNGNIRVYRTIEELRDDMKTWNIVDLIPH